MAVVLVVAVALAVVVAVGAAAFLTLYLARRWIARWLTRQLVDLAGPAMIHAMPPRQVLDTLLPVIYGERVGHHHIIASVLGGSGRELDGRDTAVSRRTSVHYSLRALDPYVCRSESTFTHEFSGVRNAHRFVIFATFDREVADLIATERLYPLFEFWRLEDEDQLEDFVPTLRESLRVGITYLDADGERHTVAPRREKGEEVAYRRYDQFIRLPEDVDRQNLRIIHFDLFDLADPDHVVRSIESLTLSATNHFPLNLGYLRWSPPHPCYTEDVVFDVEHMRPEADLVYTVVPSTAKMQAVPIDHRWSPAGDRIRVGLDAWMLPGHSVTLLWRPVDESESHGRPEPR